MTTCLRFVLKDVTIDLLNDWESFDKESGIADNFDIFETNSCQNKEDFVK